MNVTVGQSLVSSVDETKIVVIRAPQVDIDLTCGGAAMIPDGQVAPTTEGSVLPGHDAGSLLGKRYVHEGLGMELLVTRGGSGSLAVNGEILSTKAAKPLPSSD